jgi:hypothetical protein
MLTNFAALNMALAGLCGKCVSSALERAIFAQM